MLHKEKDVTLEVKLSNLIRSLCQRMRSGAGTFELCKYFKQVWYLIAHFPCLQTDRGVQGEYGGATSILRLLEVTEDGSIPEHIAKVIWSYVSFNQAYYLCYIWVFAIAEDKIYLLY